MYRSPRVSLVGEVAKGREVGCWWLGEGCQQLGWVYLIR